MQKIINDNRFNHKKNQKKWKKIYGIPKKIMVKRKQTPEIYENFSLILLNNTSIIPWRSNLLKVFFKQSKSVERWTKKWKRDHWVSINLQVKHIQGVSRKSENLKINIYIKTVWIECGGRFRFIIRADLWVSMSQE